MPLGAETNLASKARFSPYTWWFDDGAATTICAGAYVSTVAVNATEVIAHFDMSFALEPSPRIRIDVDNQSVFAGSVRSSVRVPLPATGRRRRVEIAVEATSEQLPRWRLGSPNTAVILRSIESDGILIPPESRSHHILVVGDSITEGVRILGKIASNELDRNSATLGWAYGLRREVDAEVGCVGFGNLGFTTSGSGGVPPVFDSWRMLGPSNPRSLTPAPDVVVVNLGTNDPEDAITATKAHEFLEDVLLTCPCAIVLVCVPFTGKARSALLVAAAATGSRRLTLLETDGWWNPDDSADGVHPNAYANQFHILPQIADAVRSALERQKDTYAN